MLTNSIASGAEHVSLSATSLALVVCKTLLHIYGSLAIFPPQTRPWLGTRAFHGCQWFWKSSWPAEGRACSLTGSGTPLLRMQSSFPHRTLRMGPLVITGKEKMQRYMYMYVYNVMISIVQYSFYIHCIWYYIECLLICDVVRKM